jgi:hypothetical protein
MTHLLMLHLPKKNEAKGTIKMIDEKRITEIRKRCDKAKTVAAEGYDPGIDDDALSDICYLLDRFTEIHNVFESLERQRKSIKTPEELLVVNGLSLGQISNIIGYKVEH